MSEEQDRINLANEIFKHENDINDYFLLVMAWFVLLMQFGFAFLEAGSVRAMNTVNIIWKNILDFCKYQERRRGFEDVESQDHF